MPSIATDLSAAAEKLPDMMTRKEASEFAHVSIATISRWIVERRLRATKANPAKQGRILIPKTALLELLAEGTRE